MAYNSYFQDDDMEMYKYSYNDQKTNGQLITHSPISMG